MNPVTSALYDLPLEYINGGVSVPTLAIATIGEFTRSITPDNMSLAKSISLNNGLHDINLYTREVYIVINNIDMDIPCSANMRTYNSTWSYYFKLDELHDVLVRIENRILAETNRTNYSYAVQKFIMMANRRQMVKDSAVLTALARRSETTNCAGDPCFAFRPQTWSELLN